MVHFAIKAIYRQLLKYICKPILTCSYGCCSNCLITEQAKWSACECSDFITHFMNCLLINTSMQRITRSIYTMVYFYVRPSLVYILIVSHYQPDQL